TGKARLRCQSAPSQIAVGVEWVFVDERENEFRFKVTAKDGDRLKIVKSGELLKSSMTLDMVHKTGSLALQAISFGNGMRGMKWEFDPALDSFEVMQSGNTSHHRFQIDLGDRKRLIQGTIELERRDGAIELIGHLTSPSQLQPIILKSRVTND